MDLNNLDLTTPSFIGLARDLRKLRSIVVFEKINNRNIDEIIYDIDNLISLLATGYSGDGEYVVNALVTRVPITKISNICSNKCSNEITKVYEDILSYLHK